MIPLSEPVRWIAASTAATAFGFALVLLVGAPSYGSDQGVFLSVAARMLDGDTLYAEVVDNKDPLFFYTYAAALGIGGWRAPALLDGLWFALAAVTFAGMLRALGAPRAAVVTGFLVYPLALAGGWYFSGLSMLGALSVAPGSIWLWLRRRYAAAGAVAAVAMLLKLNLALLVVTPLVLLLVFERQPVSRLRQVSLSAAGMLATLGAAALALAAQGALGAYLETIRYNVHYSNALLDTSSPVTRIRAHWSVAWHYFTAAGRWQAPAAIAVLVAFGVVAGLAFARGPRVLRVLGLLAIGTLGASVVSIALTAYWTHHLQLLALPAAFIAGSFVTAAATWGRGRLVPVAAAGACSLFALWSAAKDDWRPSVSQWSADPISAGAMELERARARFYPGRDPVEYVVFGGNSDNGHAAFVDDSFELACRWFHLYPFSTQEQFSETIDCFDREQPQLVLISLGFFDDRPGPRWRAFVSQARQRLESRYVQVGEAYPGFQVWRRTDDAR